MVKDTERRPLCHTNSKVEWGTWCFVHCQLPNKPPSQHRSPGGGGGGPMPCCVACSMGKCVCVWGGGGGH